MPDLTRRKLLSSTTAAGLSWIAHGTHASVLRPASSFAGTAASTTDASGKSSAPGIEANSRQFTMDLTPGAIGVKSNQLETIELAHKYGFESVSPDPGFLSGLDDNGREQLLESMKDKNVQWGAAGLPVDFRNDEETFRTGLQQLPRIATGLQKAGVTRVGTWLKPFHDSMTYVSNFRQHARRLREVVRILGDNGLRFGMEYVGPKTLWASTRHSFIHTMPETKELITEIGEPNVGFVLDSWHWFTSHETLDDLRTLTNQDIVACDLNDAPPDIAIDEQIDSRRELPSATGIIDLKGFLGVLKELGYDGPVRSEPFNAALNQLDNDAACTATAAAMRKAFSLVGG
ncbi:MAG: sugar phosphate isomerase/epimerase [Planctomycetaceae bacterium]|nr:sugar phosphate isomerase/epimerase [Planctomycetaceae bacterium]